MSSARVYPVVHHQHATVTLSEAALALSLGADGVFLISHGGADEELIPLMHAVMSAHPDKLIGVNFLGLDAAEAAAVCVREKFRALWVDAPGLSSAGITDQGHALVHQAQAAGITVFASVAFKYQPKEPSPGLAANVAVAQGTIPTTSGSGTGHAPEVAKIQVMREAIGSTARLALASGMTVENIEDFLPWASDFLVATGVSQDAHHFDPARLGAFIAKVHAWKRSRPWT